MNGWIIIHEELAGGVLIMIVDEKREPRNRQESRMKNILAKVLVVFLLVTGMTATYVLFGMQKESYHVDEIYTLGLSNSYFEPFFKPDGWIDTDDYLEYLSVQENEQFSFDSVYYNQTQDVHPPLYYYVYHTISSLFPQSYSKWLGISLNILFTLGSSVTLYYLGRLIFKDKSLAAIIAAAYGFCAGAVNMVIFIRMYAMLTFVTLLSTLVFGLLEIREKKLWYFVLAVIINTIGLLVQHLFLVYMLLMVCTSTIKWVRVKNGKMIALNLLLVLVSLVASIVLFPEGVDMFLNGGKGVGNLLNLTNIVRVVTKFLMFAWYLVKGIFGGPVTFTILVAIVVYLSHKGHNLFAHYKDFTRNTLGTEEGIYLNQIILVTLVVFAINVGLSPYVRAQRYIAYLYPNIVMLAVLLGYLQVRILTQDKKRRYIILVGAIVICTLTSYLGKSVDFLYSERADDLDAILSEYQEYDALAIAKSQANITIGIPLLMKHERSCNISSDLSSNEFQKLMSLGANTKRPIILYFPRWIKESVSNDEFIEFVLDTTPYTVSTQLINERESGLRTDIYLIE
jgi:hypothetical protein